MTTDKPLFLRLETACAKLERGMHREIIRQGLADLVDQAEEFDRQERRKKATWPAKERRSRDWSDDR